MLRAVLDTNIWVAAAGWHGIAHHLYQQLLGGRFVHLTSTEILTEISKTLRHLPGFTEALAYNWYCDIGSHSQLVPARSPLSERVRICRDPEDDKFLECAFWGQADYLISRDLDLLRIAEFREVHILSPERFVALLGSPS
jgi:putative PIN family toxin of toxin-antitoxin system